MAAVVLRSLLVGSLLMLAGAAAAQTTMMFDPRVVDDGAKASLLSRTDPVRANDVLRSCVRTTQQVSAGDRHQGQVNLGFCAAFDIGVAAIAGHDRRSDAGAVGQETSERVAGYLSALGARRDQLAPTVDMLRNQVAARLRVYSP